MKIAVIGSGITGLGATWSLEQGICAPGQGNDVVLYESDPRLGGHSNTVDVELQNPDGSAWHRPVDTGFIVFNGYNYPNLVKLFEHLEVDTTVTDMEFGISVGRGDKPWSQKRKLEFRANNLFAQKRNYANPRHMGMLLEILKFFRLGRLAQLQGVDPQMSLGDFLAVHRFGRAFTHDFLLPMAAAIWSGTSMEMKEYPLSTFLRFYRNHGLLAMNESPVWQTVTGGSRAYVQKVKDSLRADIRLNCGVANVASLADGGQVITDTYGDQQVFDQVIFACHSDQALKILGEHATADERAILGGITYRPNRAVLHCDPSQLPNTKGAWASWNYLADDANQDDPATAISYLMNDLQVFKSPEPVVVTVNPFADIDERKILKEFTYSHPQFDRKAIASQSRIHEIQGLFGRWFAGAWTGYGFHEDGLQSGLTVAAALGGRVPWAGSIMPMSPASQCVDFGRLNAARGLKHQQAVQTEFLKAAE